MPDSSAIGSPLYVGYLLAFAASALVCFGAAARARRIPYSDTRRGLVVFFVTSGVWAATYIGFLLPTSALAKNFFYQGSLIVGFGTVGAWLWFCSAYTGRALHRHPTVRRFAITLFAVVVLLKVTNPFHELYYTLEPAGAGPFGLVVRHQILYWVVMGVAYALASMGYLMLFELFLKTKTRTGPLAVLTALTALPAALNIIGHVAPALRDLTHEPIGVAVFAVGVLFVYTYQFEAVRLAGSLSEPTIMLDQNGRIKDVGRRAAELFPALDRPSVIGAPLASAFPALAAQIEREDALLETDGEAGTRFYRIVETDFGTGASEGHRLVVLTDITERERREQALQDRQEKVEALYAAVSRLLRADRQEDVGAIVLRLVHEVFGYPLVGVRLTEGTTLVPVDHSPEVFDRMPPRPPVDVEGESLIAQAFRDGTPVTSEDVRGADDPIEYGEARSVAFFPMGAYGTISVGHTEPGAIQSFDRYLIDVLAAHAATVLEQIEQESELRDAKEEAQQASRMKTALLANMSHEVRTPLTSIIGFAEEIETMADAEGPTRRFAELIENSGRRLLGTLDAVLNLSRLEGDGLEGSDEAVDLRRAACEVVEQFQPQAEKADIDLRGPDGEASLWTAADREALRIVLQNLVSNAVTYTEAGGAVWVRIRGEDEAAVLEVEDTGIGMVPETADVIFEPFRQASEGLNREYEGTGLGLAVTKQAVDAMEGTIAVETEEGVGSRFTVRLPRADGA
jgi:signal transduction histidine kinase